MNVLISEEAKSDMLKLPKNIQEKAIVHIRKLHFMKYGQPLKNMHGSDLSKCYKIYFGDKSEYRIVWWILDSGEIEVLEIIAIGERNKLKVYKDAGKRMKSRK